MKKNFYLFGATIIFFVVCTIKIGICQSTSVDTIPSISTQKIVDEISPFIDEDTAIICYVNLIAMRNSHKFVDVAERLAKVESFHERVRYYFTTLRKIIEKKNAEKFLKELLEECSTLIENNITHMYIILNMRDLKFGAYFVIPNVQKNSDKAKSIERFFSTKKDIDEHLLVSNRQEIWSLYEKNYMIVGGQNSVLSEIAAIYFGEEQIIQMLLIPQLANATCGYNNLAPHDRKEYINKRFKNFKSSINKNFQRGIEDVNDCNFIKSVFLFPDSVVAWEFRYLKKMDAPFNQVTFDFLKTSRDYVALGVDTEQPKIKLTIQCNSHDDAIKFKKFIDDVWWSIVNNYFIFFFSHNIQWKDKDSPKPMLPSDWADFIVSLLPNPRGNKLITVIDQNYKHHTIKDNEQNKAQSHP